LILNLNLNLNLNIIKLIKLLNMTEKKQIDIKTMNHHEFVLNRPDTYIGSCRTTKRIEYVASIEENTYQISKKEVTSNPGLNRIFIEILSNVIDNKWRSEQLGHKMTTIKIDIDKENGTTCVWNDGAIISCKKGENDKEYKPEIAFGSLLSSSNYDDTIERKTSGLNGIGSKGCNIFSSYFKVKINDPENKIQYKQEWKNNMYDKEKPKITISKLKGNFTEITYIPDFKRFGLEGYTDDILSIYLKYILDTAMLTKIPIIFNKKKIPIKSLLDYSKMYDINKQIDELENIKEETIKDELDEKDELENIEEENDEDEEKETIEKDKILQKKDERIYLSSKDCEVVLVSNDDIEEFENISFVNGINTSQGGVHVEQWTEALFRPILDKLNNKGKRKPTSPKSKSKVKDKQEKPKKNELNISHIKKYFRIFVVSIVDKPSFTSQEKTYLVKPDIHISNITQKLINTILKWNFIDKINDFLKNKELLVLKSFEKKRGSYIKIEGYDPANYSGTKEAMKCSLILCEGLSAKEYVVTGIEKGMYNVSGRNYFGILPLRGKLLNVRNSNITSISANKVVSDIIKALNIQPNVDYKDDTNFHKLFYGKVILFCDRDVDGKHIAGLIINLFHYLFPTVMERTEPFIINGITPIIRVFGDKKSKEDLLFYDEYKFKKYIENEPNKKFKYYKGLGTNKIEDVFDTFGEKIVEYKLDDKTDININKVFNKKLSNLRKTWMEDYIENSFSLDDVDKIYTMTVSDFLDNEMIHHSLDNCKRTIPSIIDGLKDVQRKILYATKKKNLNYKSESLKVAQLGAYVAEHVEYAHGETNIFEAIIKMAQEFVGSNNIPLFYRDGMFGTRTHNGNNYASPRYIYTKLDLLTNLIYRSEDEPLLEHNMDDNMKTEYKHFIPIIPMILVNGCVAIATGYSCEIPNFDPIVIIDCIKIWLNKKDDFPELIPTYRNFTGKIEKKNSTTFITYGNIENINNTILINEIPIGISIDSFKERLEDLILNKQIKSIENQSTSNKPVFIIKENNVGNFKCDINSLKLFSSLSLSNMVLYDKNNKIKKYQTVENIITEFCEIRYEYYIRRKKYQIQRIENEIQFLQNKVTFLEEVMYKKLIIMNVNENDIILELEKRNYIKIDKNYDYLLNLQIKNFTKEKINKLKEELENNKIQLEIIKNKTEKEMWIDELDELVIEYNKWIIIMNNIENSNKINKNKLKIKKEIKKKILN
jgi:DNA topoisomerase-2